MQSNEPAICEMQDRLHDTGGLDRIILVESDLVNKPVHPNKLNADTWRSLLEFHGKEAMTSVEFLKASREEKETSIKEEMFEKIIDVIDREYAGVLRSAEESGPERRLDIILWCLKKKFLQQAMTYVPNGFQKSSSKRRSTTRTTVQSSRNAGKQKPTGRAGNSMQSIPMATIFSRKISQPA